MSKLWQFLQGHPEPEFSKKSAKGGSREIFQIWPKNSARLKGPNALAQMALSSNLDELKVQRLQKILGQKSISKSAQMTKLWQSFARSPKTRIF